VTRSGGDYPNPQVGTPANQTRDVVAKRRAVMLLAVGGILVALALSNRWWLPYIPTLFSTIESNRELIGAYADLATIASVVVSLVGGILVVLGFRKLQSGNDEEQAQQSVTVDRGGRSTAVGDVHRGAVVAGDHNRIEVQAGVTYAYSEVEPSAPDPAELEGARRQLNALPLEDVPDRGAGLPARSLMPLRPNPHFVGRRDDLKNIAATLKAGGAAAIGEVTVAASSGLGGVGKTQLACEFVYRYGRYFHSVYWLNFGDPSGVPTEVAACGGFVGMNLRPDFYTLSLDERVEAVMAEWKGELPRLLVFDNCEEEELLDQWLPSTGGCRVLVTSRRPTWDPSLDVTDLNLGVLDRAESVALLREYLPDLPSDDSSLHAVAEELGDLPLALDLAGRYLKRYSREVTPTDYLADIRRPELLEHPSLRRARGISPTKHDMDVWRTFALSYRRLDNHDETDGRAIGLLARIARLAPGQPIPEELLTLSLDPSGDLGTRPSVPPTLVRDALERLTEIGLLGEESDGTYGMHRLVAAFALAEVGDEEAQAAVEAACARAAMEAFSEGHPARQEVLVPHVRVLVKAAMGRVDFLAAEICTAASVGLSQLGIYDETLPFAQRAAEICTELYGPNHRLTLQRRSNVGLLLERMGEGDASKTVYREVLSAQEDHLGPKDPDVAATLNNLAASFSREALYHEALPLYRRALSVREQVWEETGPDDPARRENAYEAAEGHANMGALLMDLGRPRQALPHLENALNVLGSEFGENHERNAGWLVLRGAALRALGSDPEAAESIRRALDIYDSVGMGATVNAAGAIANLGAFLAELAEEDGVYEEQRAPLREMAGGWLQGALTGSAQNYGDEHPLTGGLHGELGRVRDAQGATQDALRHWERAEACRQRNLQGADVEAAAATDDAAGWLMHWGLYEEAQVYLERVVVVREDVLGHRNFDTSTSLFKLGILFQRRRLDAQARSYLEPALAVRERVCGPNHPAAEIVRENLSLLNDSSPN